MKNYFEEIAEIIADVADLELGDIEEESLLMDDLDLSSLEIMALVSKVEEKFGVKIGEKELLNIEAVKDIVDLIESK